MRSRLIMNFMQASNSRASVAVTWVMAVVTPASISMSRRSSSFSRSRSVFSSGQDAVAIPSAAVAAASVATRQASMVRFTRWAYGDSGSGLLKMAVLMRASLPEATRAGRNTLALILRLLLVVNTRE